MANTPNLDLVKPAGTDKALVSVINSNSDKIDAGFGSLSDQIETVNSKIEKELVVFYGAYPNGKLYNQNYFDITVPYFNPSNSAVEVNEAYVYSTSGFSDIKSACSVANQNKAGVNVRITFDSNHIGKLLRLNLKWATT